VDLFRARYALIVRIGATVWLICRGQQVNDVRQ